MLIANTLIVMDRPLSFKLLSTFVELLRGGGSNSLVLSRPNGTIDWYRRRCLQIQHRVDPFVSIYHGCISTLLNVPVQPSTPLPYPGAASQSQQCGERNGYD